MADPYTYEELAAKDKRYVWHPFTQMQEYAGMPPLIVDRGDGLKIYDIEGREYWDGISSLWVNVHGHRVPAIDAAIRAQLDRIAHSTLLGHANVPSILLAEKLVDLTPEGLNRVFFSDSGSEAVEIGLKIAYQYWRLKGQNRRLMVKMANAYHGDTIGSVSLGGIDLFHEIYADLLFPTLGVPYPHVYRFNGDAAACAEHCLAALKTTLSEHAGEIIGVIVEPLVQGAAGIITMPPGFLREMAELCREYDVLLLADEVATGFGRTGAMFACDHEAVRPDILMTAKGLTGGYLPVAATLTSDSIYEAFLGTHIEHKTFFHGHSYTGNQLGCAAALANIRIFEESDLIRKIAVHADELTELLKPLSQLKHVGDIRQCGFMVGIELQRDPAFMLDYDIAEQVGNRVGWRCRELGMLSRPLGDVVVFMPPLVVARSELQAMLDILKQAILDVTGNDWRPDWWVPQPAGKDSA